MRSTKVEVIASPETWMESDAIQQLRTVSGLPGMVRTVGMPDLHPGKGAPIGAAFACAGWVYPHLIGNDIGCGTALWRTDLTRKAVKLDRWERRLVDMDGAWDGDVGAWLAGRSVAPTTYDTSLGTIGGGNHFAEVQCVEDVVDPVAAIGLEADHLLILVHSGSRGLGEGVLRAHVERFGNSGLADGTDDQVAYMRGLMAQFGVSPVVPRSSEKSFDAIVRSETALRVRPIDANMQFPAWLEKYAAQIQRFAGRSPRASLPPSKKELIYPHVWPTRHSVRAAVFTFIEGWYNRLRLPSTLCTPAPHVTRRTIIISAPPPDQPFPIHPLKQGNTSAVPPVGGRPTVLTVEWP